MSRLGSLYIELGEPEGPLCGGCCEVDDWAAEEIIRLRAALENNADIASKALRRAWQLGQTYWQQADSEYQSQWKKADETQEKFNSLVDETRSTLIAAIDSALKGEKE